MPRSYSPQEPNQPTGSIVDRAEAVLEDERAGATPEHAARAATPFDQPVAALTELEQRVRGVREQIQDLVDAFSRFGERLPALVASGSLPSDVGATTVPSRIRTEGEALPLLRTARVSAGDLAHVALGLVNGSGEPASVLLSATSLVSELGHEIPAKNVAFAPNPSKLPGRGELPVRASVTVPPGTPPGKYSGLVQGAGLDAARAVMTVIVAPRAAPAVPR
jgi:hypothetical protein